MNDRSASDDFTALGHLSQLVYHNPDSIRIIVRLGTSRSDVSWHAWKEILAYIATHIED
jgi:hypothetical protein